MRTLALQRRIFKQVIRDKRTLALMMIAPLIILTLIYFLFKGGTTVNPVLGVLNVDKDIINELKNKDVIVKEYVNIDNDKNTIINDKLDGVLKLEDHKFEVTFKNSDPSIKNPLQIKIQQILAADMTKKRMSMMNTNKNIQKLPKIKDIDIDTSYIYGDKDTSFLDILSPILVGFFVFFFVFLISGIGQLKERTTRTLERLVSTPVKRHEIVLGYLLGYGFFAIIQTLIVVFYSVKVLDIVMVGNMGDVILITFLLALVALSLGILLSAFANSEFQMVQFIPVIIIPQIFFAGIFPIENMTHWLQVFAKFMPMYYGGRALENVMYKGFLFNDIKMDLLMLVLFVAVFIVLNIFTLKKYRSI